MCRGMRLVRRPPLAVVEQAPHRLDWKGGKGRSAGSLLTLEGSFRGAVTVAGAKGPVAAGHRPTPSPVDRW